MSDPKAFTFTFTGDVTLSVADIWPDGDAPANPTVDDVLKVIAKCGGKWRIIRDWDLDGDLDLEVTDNETWRMVP